MGRDVSAAGDSRSVAVIGGGIAGIAAAIKLYQQGYDVTLLEKEQALGGNLSSNSKNDAYKEKGEDGGLSDIYPHIFGDWYREFWYLLENDLKLDRDKLFARRDRIKMALIPVDAKAKIKCFADVKYTELATPTSLSNLVDNLYCGVLSKRDMTLFGYTYLDLVSVAQTPKPLKVLNELDVTGYLYSRPFMNNAVADFHDDILKVIWSMPTDQTSAQAYQNLIRHTLTFPNETPFAWLAKGPLGKILMEPIKNELCKALGDELKLGAKVTVARVLDRGVRLRWTISGQNEQRDFDYVVVATPAPDALKLAFEPLGPDCMVSKAPNLALLREAETGRIPVVYLRFKRAFLNAHRSELSTLPREMTGFRKAVDKAAARLAAAGPPQPGAAGIDCDISIVNLAGLWTQEDLGTNAADDPVLVLAASRSDAIMAPAPGARGSDGGRAEGHALIRKLCEYMPFIKSGEKWGDENSDADWATTRVISNALHQLFLNDSGSDEWRPCATVKGLENVFFAGDYCMTDVDMATVEAATQSGVLAAKALQEKAGFGQPIYLQAHDIYATQPLLLGKLMLAPAAFGAALAATYEEAEQDPLQAMLLPYSAAVLATSYWADWLRSALGFWRGFMPVQEWSASGAPADGNVADHDNRIGLIKSALNVAYALATEGPVIAPRLRDEAMEGLYTAWYWTIGRSLFPGIRPTLKDPNHPRKSRRGALPTSGPDLTNSTAVAQTPPALPTDTWLGLAKKAVGLTQVTPSGLADTTFGIASGAVSFLQQVSTRASQPADQRPTYDALLMNAVRDGAAARRRKAGGFRAYDTIRSLPSPAASDR